MAVLPTRARGSTARPPKDGEQSLRIIHEVLRRTGTNGAILPALNRSKAKIVRLHSDRLKTALIDTMEAGRLEGKQPTLYQPPDETETHR